MAPIPTALPAPILPAAMIVLQDGQGAPAGDGAATTAQDAPAGEGAPPGLFGSMWFPILMMVAIFWLIVIGPERKNRKKREQMLSALAKGDRVVTTGGLFGQVTGVQDNVVTLQVADGVRMRFARHAIQTIVDEGGEGAAAKDPKAS